MTVDDRIWDLAGDWISGRPGVTTVEVLAQAAEGDLPTDLVAYLAPALIGCASHPALRRLAMSVGANAMLAEESQRQAAQDFVRACEARSVPCIFYKGADLRYRVYSDPVTRASNDLDVLVAGPDAALALEAAREIGARPREAEGPFLSGRYHEVALDREGVSIDLHTSLLQAGRSAFRAESVIEGRTWIDVAGGRLPVACPEDALAMCLVHIGRHEGGAEYIAFKHGLDLLVATRRWNELSWPAVADRTREWRCHRLAGAGLWTWRPRLGAWLPEAAFAAMDPGPIARRLALRTSQVLANPQERATGAARLSQLARKFAYAEGGWERLWLVRELSRRLRDR